MDQASLFSLLSFGPDGWGQRFVEGLVVTVEVSVSAYPEKHPESATFDSDLDALKAKIDAGLK